MVVMADTRAPDDTNHLPNQSEICGTLIVILPSRIALSSRANPMDHLSNHRLAACYVPGVSGNEDDDAEPPSTGNDAQENRRSERRRRTFEVPWLQSARIKYGSNIDVQDVSPSGIRFRTDKHLTLNTNIVLELTGPHGTTLVPAR